MAQQGGTLVPHPTKITHQRACLRIFLWPVLWAGQNLHESCCPCATIARKRCSPLSLTSTSIFPPAQQRFFHLVGKFVAG